ncbi:MAG TPA: hypothetical protein PKC43_06865 [Phycisphaerales bacterium]|nr:hypothetical protein [Phycisphaerales bacterium]HMP37154.1 hypothetical protein [Phycisphaerales bacterium]
MLTVLFICTGNTCRSPMAEAIARDALDRGAIKAARGLDLFVASAGVSAGEGVPVADEAIATLRSLGIAHRGASKRLTPEMIRRADLVLAMTEDHAAAARSLVPGEPAVQAKINRLDPAGDIEDPIGLGVDAYESVAGRLRAVVPARLETLIDEALKRTGAGPGGVAGEPGPNRMPTDAAS